MKGNTDRVAIINAIEHASREELTALSAIEKSIRGMGNAVDGAEAKVTSRLRQRTVNQADVDPGRRPNPYRRSLSKSKNRKQPPRVNKSAAAPSTAVSVRPRKPFDIEADGERAPLKIKLKIEQEEPKKQGPKRDSNGRYISQDAAAQNRQKLHDRANGDLKNGFFRKLGSLFGESSKGGGGGDNAIGDAVGLSAGGPLWMATKGLYDMGKAAHKNVVSMSDWMKDKEQEQGEKNKKWFARKQKPASPVTDNVIHYPAATAAHTTAPVLGSAKTFGNAAEVKSAKAVEEQTKKLAANDERIVDGLDDVQDEIQKLRKSLKNGFGLSLPRRFPGRPGRNNRTPSKPGKNSPKEKPKRSNNSNPGNKKPPKKNLLKKVLSSGKTKIIGGLLAGATAIGGALLTKKTKAPALDNLTPDKSVKQATKTTEKAAEKAAVKTAEKTTAKTAENTAEKAAKVAATKSTEVVAEKGAVAASEKVGEKTLAKGAAHTGAKIAGKTALKAIPLVGTALGVGWDAVDGWSDEDNQRKAFKLADDQEVSTRQKATFSAASILDLGGLVSGGSSLLGSGLSAIGLDGIGNKMQFDTADIAAGLNGAIEGAKTGIISLTDGAKSFFTADAKASKEIAKAVDDGAGKTVIAINALGTKLQGGTFGEDGVGTYGTNVSDFNSPSENNIGTDLNIGGQNAKNRSFRNNNFGNLNYIGQEGASLEAKNSKGEARFARFNTPEEGMRALANQVTLYSTGRSKAAGYQKLETVSQIISKWAPTNENDTNAYIQAVSQKLGVKPNDKIDTSDQNVMTALIRAIATHEGGNPQVNDDFIKSAIGNYDSASGKWVGGQFSDESLAKVNEERAKQGQGAVSKDSLYSSGSKVKLHGGAQASVIPKSVPLVSPTASPVSNEAYAKAEAAQNNSVTAQKVETSSGEEAPKTIDAQISEQNASLMNELANAKSPEEIAAIAAKAKSGQQGMLDMLAGGQLPSLAMPELPAAVQEKVSQVKELVAKSGARIGFRRPGSELSTPSGQEIPAGLIGATENPTDLAKRRSAKAKVEGVDLIGSSAPEAIPGPAGENQSILTGREAGEDKGLLGSLMDSSLTGLKNVGAAVLPALGDRASNLIGGIQGTNVVNDLITRVSGNNTNITRAVSPLTQRAGEYLNGGIQSAADGTKNTLNDINNSLFSPSSVVARQEPIYSMPRQMPTVTDLAASGVRQPTTADKGNHDLDILKSLERLNSTLGDLLGVSKTAAKKEPDRVTSTAQPAPRERVSTSINDPSLDALLKD